LEEYEISPQTRLGVCREVVGVAGQQSETLMAHAMNIEFLGTGGAISTPRALCECRVCAEAREKGVPYSRGGPSVFVHGPDILIDTPEEIKDEINRSKVRNINACLYSHWHPDHVMGRRVFESLNWDVRGWPPNSRRTDVYLPEKVGRDFRNRLGSFEHFEFLEYLKLVRIVEMEEGESVEIGGVRIFPFPLAEDFVYAFLFEDGGKRVLIAPDETLGWEPPEWVKNCDLAILPKGITEVNSLTGERIFPREHPVLGMEATFEETLGIIEKLGAKRVVLTHIEEMCGMSYDDLKTFEGRLRGDGVDITFAHDTMMAEV
jgi:phosphoribosyl 1,2-cyclic phosphate phosphodiesterase